MYLHGEWVEFGPERQRFRIRVSNANIQSIHMYCDGLTYLARVRGKQTGEVLRPQDYPDVAGSFVISVGERFLAINNLGNQVQGKIVDVKHENAGADHNEVTFDYVIAPARGGDFIAS